MEKRAYSLLFMLGLISFFGDFCYEGMRSIIGQYLSIIGASATLVGFISSLAEMTGYLLRPLFSFIADKLNIYWASLFIGYGLSAVSIPLTGFTTSIFMVFFLMIVERMGKAIRTPIRDVLIGRISKTIGMGKGFGIHHAFDQMGAILGPLMVSIVLMVQSSYKLAFAMLLIPGLFSIVALFILKKNMKDFELSLHYSDPRTLAMGIGQPHRTYILFSFLIMLAFPSFSLIGYHMKAVGFSDESIPQIYSIAMILQAFISVTAGLLMDRYMVKALVVLPFLSVLAPLMCFSTDRFIAGAGVFVWGALRISVFTILPAFLLKIFKGDNVLSVVGFAQALWGVAQMISGTLVGLSLIHI